MKAFCIIFALLGTIGLIGGIYEDKTHAIFLGLMFLSGALAFYQQYKKEQDEL